MVRKTRIRKDSKEVVTRRYVRTKWQPLPGKAVEARIGKKEARTVYKVEVIDETDKGHMVCMDTNTGAARTIDQSVTS